MVLQTSIFHIRSIWVWSVFDNTLPRMNITLTKNSGSKNGSSRTNTWTMAAKEFHILHYLFPDAFSSWSCVMFRNGGPWSMEISINFAYFTFPRVKSLVVGLQQKTPSNGCLKWRSFCTTQGQSQNWPIFHPVSIMLRCQKTGNITIKLIFPLLKWFLIWVHKPCERAAIHHHLWWLHLVSTTVPFFRCER